MAVRPKKQALKPKEPVEAMTGLEAARLLMLESPRRVQQLAQEGYIDRAGRGRYVKLSVIQGYIRFLQDDRKSSSRTAAENRVRDARARDFEVRTAKAAHELVELAEAEAVLDEIVGTLRSEITGLSAQVTRDLQMRQRIDDAIDGVFERVSGLLLEKIAVLGQSGEAVDADAEATP